MRTKPVVVTFVVLNDRQIPSKTDGHINKFITKRGYPVAGSWTDMFKLARSIGGTVIPRPPDTAVIPFRD